MFPFSTHRPRRAVRGWDADSSAVPAGPRTIPLRRFASSARTRADHRRRIALAVFRCRGSQCGDARSVDERLSFVAPLPSQKELLRMRSRCAAYPIFPFIFDRPRGCHRGNRSARSHAIRRCKLLRNVSAVRPESCTVAILSARRSATRLFGRSRPGRTLVLPSCVRRRSWGSDPSQVCSRSG